MDNDRGSSGLVSRRAAMRGAAGVAGAAWLVPAVTIVSMESASAASAAPPPSGGGGEQSSPASSLAFTGSSTGEATAVGIASIAAGAAAIAVTRAMRRREVDEVPPTGRHRPE